MPPGRPPTTQERLLLASVDTLAPHESLDRVDRAASTVTTAVSIAGTVVAGLGALAATSSSGAGIGWALPTISLAAMSVACAILASVPGASNVAPGNLIAVEEFFRSEVQRRGRLVRLAGYALAVAMLLAPAPLLVAAIDNGQASLDLAVRVSATDRKLAVAVRASGLDEDARTRLTVTSAGRVLSRVQADADADGNASGAVALPPLPPGTSVMIVATSTSPSVRRTDSISIPPSR